MDKNLHHFGKQAKNQHEILYIYEGKRKVSFRISAMKVSALLDKINDLKTLALLKTVYLLASKNSETWSEVAPFHLARCKQALCIPSAIQKLNSITLNNFLRAPISLDHIYKNWREKQFKSSL